MEIEVKRVDFGSLKALVSVTIDGIVIRGFKVVNQDSKTGAWIAPPSREIKRNGKTEFYSIVRFVDDERKKKFNEEILEAYRKRCEEDASVECEPAEKTD